MRILGPITRNGHSSTHTDCIKRGSGWHPFRDLLASSSDHISSPPFESPTSKISPFLGTLLYFSSFCLPSCLINACLRLVSTLLYEFRCHIPSRTRVFSDPLWPLLTIFPINRLVLYSIFFSSFPNLSFCCLNSLMLVVSWSLLLLLSALFWFTATSFHLTMRATMRKTRESSSRGMPPIY